jgi:Ni/Co efflux regulator RcnB
MKLPLLALIAAAAVMIAPGTAEAKSYKYKHSRKHHYSRHYDRHSHHSSYCRAHGRHRHYYRGRTVYYYGSHRWAYGYPSRSGINVYLDL